MIVILKQGVSPEAVHTLEDSLEQMGLRSQVYPGHGVTAVGILGDTTAVDLERIGSLPMVERVCRISEPYKLPSRKLKPQDTVVEIGNVKLGGKHFAMIAGPCSVESEDQIISIARAVQASGADILRGGAFKPRTSPYMFQGLKQEGLALLLQAKKEIGLPIVTEIMDLSVLDQFSEVDMIQVGARNMQNFPLLRELGRCGKPILLKRGMANTLQELLMSAEYIMAEGNPNIVLCERGIRTFEPALRSTMDLSAIPALQEMTHLPIIADPSHATGKARFVAPMAYAAAAAGAHGIMVEVHQAPSCALCDGAQAITPHQFAELNQKARSIRQLIV